MKRYQVIAMHLKTGDMTKTSKVLSWSECEAVYNDFFDTYDDHQILILELP